MSCCGAQAEEDARADAALALKRKRELDAIRMQQLMPAVPVPHSARQASSMPASVYNPVAGFTVFFDFLTGLPARMENVSLIFCLFDGPTAKTKVRDAPSRVTEWEAADDAGSGGGEAAADAMAASGRHVVR